VTGLWVLTRAVDSAAGFIHEPYRWRPAWPRRSRGSSAFRDESLEDLDNLPAPEVIAREIVEDLTAALAEFEAVAAAREAANVSE